MATASGERDQPVMSSRVGGVLVLLSHLFKIGDDTQSHRVCEA